MKICSSNLQLFVGIRSILKTVVNDINGIKLLVNSIPKLSVAVQFNPKLDTLTETFNTLGEIQITSKEAAVPYVERGLIQAQYHLPAKPPVHTINNLRLKLRTTIIGEKIVNVTSCLILPNKCIMTASFNEPSLSILREDGSHDRDVSVPYDPYDVTITDDQRVAVSYRKKCISLVNLNTDDTNQILGDVCTHEIKGITYNNGKLYAVAWGEGIKVIDLDGNIIKTIRIYNDAIDTYQIATQTDKIYYSVYPGSVYCVDMEGTEIWTYQDERLQSLNFCPAIAVDNNGIAFAAGRDNNILVAISPDGKQQKVLLTRSDGLLSPNDLYYDKDSKRLLVCNGQNGQAAVYDVIY